MAELQSPPPTRASPSKSEVDSTYSLDLGALDQDSHSGTSTPLPKPHVDRILSEDIDGPSDFTLNMEKWMRGGTLGRGTVKSKLGGSNALTGRAAVEQEIRAATEDHGLPESPQNEAGIPEDEEEHTPSNSPQRDHGYQPRAEVDGDVVALELDHQELTESSQWDPYGSTTTPHHAQKNNLLQPTVEDYHSELTPARPTSSRQISTKDKPGPVHEDDEAQSEPLSPGRPSSPTLSPVRSPVIIRTSSKDAPTNEDERLKRQTQELEARCQQLQHLNDALSKALDEERHQRRMAADEHNAATRDAKRREHDLVQMKDEAYRHNDDFRREFGTLNEELQKRDKDLEQYRDITDAQRAEIEKLENVVETRHQTSAQREVSIHQECQEQISSLKLDLEEAHKAAKEAQDEARFQHDELEEYRGDKSDELEQLKLQVQSAGDLKATIVDLGAQLQTLRKGKADAEEKARAQGQELQKLVSSQEAEIERIRLSEQNIESLKAQVKEFQEQLQEYERKNSQIRLEPINIEEQLEATKAEHDNERREQSQKAQRLTEEKLKAIELAETLQVKLKEARQELKDTHAKHKQDLKRQSEALEPNDDAVRSELNEAILERDQAKDELQSVRENLNAAKRQAQTALEDLEELRACQADVNEAMDAKISRAIWRREARWKQKIDVLLEERAKLSTLVMRYWGSRELGDAGEKEMQGYEYKFAKQAKMVGRDGRSGKETAKSNGL